MRILLFVGLMLTGFFNAFSQEEVNVRKPIDDLFRWMQSGDSALARSAFASSVTSATIFKDKSGKTIIQRETSIAEFMKAIGTPHKEVWNEEIWNLKTQIDGEFAQVWCDYAFYVDKNFSHCGVDAFHLYRENGVWKIFHLADTRRREGCNVPQEIKDKHK